MTAHAKYKTTLAFLQSAGIAAIDRLLLNVMPEANFGLLTFEDDDFEYGNITYLLYQDVPEVLPVTVSANQSLERAVYEIQQLNSHVRFVANGQPFTACDDKPCPDRVQLLLVISNHLSVNHNGMLVY